MKNILPGLLIILFAGCQHAQDEVTNNSMAADSVVRVRSKEAVVSDFLNRYPLVTWLNKTPVEIGCMLETAFGHRDRNYNCDNRDYVNQGDPCKNTREYYEGVAFPQHLVHNIHPAVEDIHLAFEHGNLREVTIGFKDKVRVASIRNNFSLPAGESKMPENIINISYNVNGTFINKVSEQAYARALSLTAFEYQDARNTDCE